MSMEIEDSEFDDGRANVTDSKSSEKAVADALEELTAKDLAEMDSAPPLDAGDPIEPAIEPAIESEPEPVKEIVTEPDDGIPQTSEPGDVQPVEQWNAEQNAAFEKMDGDAKQAYRTMYLDQQSNFNKGVQKYEAKNRFANEVEAIITPEARQAFEGAGLDTLGGLRQLVALQTVFSRNPRDGLIQLATQANIDLASFAQPGVDPQVVALQQQVKALSQGQDIANINQQQQENAQHYAAATEAVTQFEYATDANGNLENPHFQVVRQGMSELMKTEPYKGADFKTLYDAACRMNPEVAQQAEKLAVDKALAERDAKTGNKAAQNAARANRRGDHSDVPVKNGSLPSRPTIAQSIAAAEEELGGGDISTF